VSAAQGSAGNVIAAVCSLVAPGLGQLVQGRIGKALWHFLLGGALWLVSFGTLGWLMHLWSCYEAATWEG
jgi:TM2 domain-containing membrane protein YozV